MKYRVDKETKMNQIENEQDEPCMSLIHDSLTPSSEENSHGCTRPLYLTQPTMLLSYSLYI